MKRILLTLSSLFLYTICSAQSSAREFQNLINVATVSPDVASLGKFGNIPVSYPTGVPSITIPLYEIHAGKIDLPLSLDYNSAGIRVDEIASGVGLGWALNGIGAVSRNMVGLPDEGTGGYLSAPPVNQLYNYWWGQAYGPTTDMAYASFYRDIMMNQRETEPDIFSYSTIGSGGKFIYRQNGTFMQTPVTSNRIEKVGADFKITDESGMVFIFDQQELTQAISGSSSSYTSSWRLSKIIDPSTADTVYIKYTSHSGTLERTWNYSYTSGTACSAPGSNVDVTGEHSMVTTTSHSIELTPSEINWRGGKVVFVNASDRTDRQQELRLDSVKVYAKLNNAYTLVKKVKLHQSNFFSNPIPGQTADYRNYRLRLDSVKFLPINTTDQPQVFKMTYDNSNMAPNESYAQDQWGFNNGKFNNTSLMPVQTILYNGAYITFGEANLDPDSTAMGAWMIRSIEYPTKGKSVFEFEPHKYKYNTNASEIQPVLISQNVDLHDGVHQTISSTFTIPSTASAFRYSVDISTYTAQQGVTDYPRAILTDQTSGQEALRVTNINGSQQVSTGTNQITLTPGHTYQLTASTYTLNQSVRVNATISWLQPPDSASLPKFKIGAGMRVKSITNYDNNGTFISKDSYEYGSNGIGDMITYPAYLLLNYEDVFYRCSSAYPGSPTGCIVGGSDYVRTYHSRSIYPATQFSGSPVVYGAVTKYNVAANGQTGNGKSLFQYEVVNDNSAYASTDYGIVGAVLVNNGWLNGFLKRESVYKSTGSGYTLISAKENNYTIRRQDTLVGLKIKVKYQDVGGCQGMADTVFFRYNIGLSKQYFAPVQMPVYTGAKLLQSESDTTWDDAGRKLVMVKNFYYEDPTHNFPTKKETFNSGSDNLTDVISYPHSLASPGNVYQKMVDRNILSPIVRFQQLKNGNQIALANINYYDWFGNSKLLLPQTVDQQVQTNPIITRVRFNSYDAYGNILQQQKVNGPYQSYQWGYNKQYPVTIISNAANNEFYAENFEESTITNVITGTGHTGTKYYNGSYTVNWTRPNSRSYVISYWYLSNGSWLLQNAVPYTGSSYALTGGSAYDDIRIYPVDSQMSTYTYSPLIGMTSATDAKNQTTYYDYDGLQRLKNVKDKDGNIVKHAEYHYKAQ
ncbi:hypothetical protein J3L18_25020 [Mucilaginibacter gossypii]|uniref:hypothetical protein n=1 Tax=Mucilaginibacter gossypii TaxID=551996 RepID=UPI000DCC750A|nr:MULTISPECIES: hypothetical protein [Mucilaginibacter]QTE36362.1 hypothetical protein J3L18_25020 [Mucilaginibacter gossypii]RAV55859.1 hypothetical protein DIU36_16205 [Mucilaginibacter rubeus]